MQGPRARAVGAAWLAPRGPPRPDAVWRVAHTLTARWRGPGGAVACSGARADRDRARTEHRRSLGPGRGRAVVGARPPRGGAFAQHTANRRPRGPGPPRGGRGPASAVGWNGGASPGGPRPPGEPP